jgi:hypothetical protein
MYPKRFITIPSTTHLPSFGASTHVYWMGQLHRHNCAFTLYGTFSHLSACLFVDAMCLQLHNLFTNMCSRCITTGNFSRRYGWGVAGIHLPPLLQQSRHMALRRIQKSLAHMRRSYQSYSRSVQSHLWKRMMGMGVAKAILQASSQL